MRSTYCEDFLNLITVTFRILYIGFWLRTKLERIYTHMNRRNVHVDRCDIGTIVTPWSKYAMLGFLDAQFCTKREQKRVLSLDNFCIFRIRSSMKTCTMHQEEIESLPLPTRLKKRILSFSLQKFCFREHRFECDRLPELAFKPGHFCNYQRN